MSAPFPESPPSRFPQPKILFDLRLGKKSETCLLILQQHFGHIRTDIQNINLLIHMVTRLLAPLYLGRL